jgi:hypothetical protein
MAINGPIGMGFLQATIFPLLTSTINLDLSLKEIMKI